jgi:small subunit ribosomal protein S16
VAVKIRLARFGSKKRPVYRMIVSDERNPRDGRFIERVGWFDPRLKTQEALKINLERIDHWIQLGAQTSEKVASLIQRARKSTTA